MRLQHSWRHRMNPGTDKFESPADAGLSNRSIGAEAPAAAFGKTASADFASAGYKYGGDRLAEPGGSL